MSAFTLDTSGSVRRPGFARPLGWSDLDAFEQGYVEALFATVIKSRSGFSYPLYEIRAFSDLAPETLAAMLEDCAAIIAADVYNPTHRAGLIFWHDRQDGTLLPQGFPPLTLYLGDGGKIYQRETA